MSRLVERVGWGYLIIGTVAAVGIVLWRLAVGDTKTVGVMWPFIVFGLLAIAFYGWLDYRKRQRG